MMEGARAGRRFPRGSLRARAAARSALGLVSMTSMMSVLACAVAARAQLKPAPAPQPQAPAANTADAGAPQAVLPPEHVPRIEFELAPTQGISAGDVVRVTLRADALLGDDVTVPEQTFAPFEVRAKHARVEPAQNGRQRFVFEIELLAIEPGKHELKPIQLRVVTKDGFVGNTETKPLTIAVASLLANEPNAKLKPETKPIGVMQDDYTLLYVLAVIAGAGLIALATWLVVRYLERRKKPLPPPPPPRPPWEIAVEKLAALRRRKQSMVEQGKAAQFVDEVSDVVREYLGGRFGFDGLETTTDEMLQLLRSKDANLGLWQEVAAYLARCDLVKFAKVEPDQDEADLVYAKAQDIVQFSSPMGAHGRSGAAGGASHPGPDAAAVERARDGEPPR